MFYDYTPSIIGIKITSSDSMAKSISVIRKYNHAPINEIKKAIESRDFVLKYSVLDSQGIRTIRKCYDDLIKLGNKVELYEDDELISREIVSNLIRSHRQTEREVRAQVDAEVAAEGGDDD